MNFKITTLSTIEQATGLVIVIDVFRAFSTACYVFSAGAKRIVAVETIKDALTYKKTNPEYILIGERKGLKVDGFDYNNSPSQIKGESFQGKTIIMTTGFGTKGIIRATNADDVLTGSFVNSSAVVAYVKQKNPDTVSFVCTDDTFYNNEDFQCAAYIQSLINDTPISFPVIRRFLEEHPCTDRFLKSPVEPYFLEDFELCMRINFYPAVLQAVQEKGLVSLYAASKQ